MKFSKGQIVIIARCTGLLHDSSTRYLGRTGVIKSINEDLQCCTVKMLDMETNIMLKHLELYNIEKWSNIKCNNETSYEVY
jgi:hypothetical protein